MRITVSVTNDLVTDQRVHKVCTTLMQSGYEVKLIGRMLPHSKPVNRPYQTKRMYLLFHRTMFFYVEYNIRLFLYLLFDKTDIIFRIKKHRAIEQQVHPFRLVRSCNRLTVRKSAPNQFYIIAVLH